MKRLTIFTIGLLLFGAGFLVGHYVTVVNATAKIETRDAASQVATQKPMENSLAKFDHPAHFIRFTSNSKPGTDSESVQKTPSRALPPHEMALIAEAQAQLAAQQLEAKQASISQMEAMIHSMEEGGAPAENIKNFRDLQKAMEEELIEDSQTPETNLPELTEDELKNDLAASLEQVGIPPTEINEMLDGFLPPPESIHDSP